MSHQHQPVEIITFESSGVPADFAMSYPCYVPVHPTRQPHVIAVGEIHCVAIFLDDNALTKHLSLRSVHHTSLRGSFRDPDTLADFLEQCNGRKLATATVLSHVMIDASHLMLDPSRTEIWIFSIQEFVDYLRGTSLVTGTARFKKWLRKVFSR